MAHKINLVPIVNQWNSVKLYCNTNKIKTWLHMATSGLKLHMGPFNVVLNLPE